MRPAIKKRQYWFGLKFAIGLHNKIEYKKQKSKFRSILTVLSIKDFFSFSKSRIGHETFFELGDFPLSFCPR